MIPGGLTKKFQCRFGSENEDMLTFDEKKTPLRKKLIGIFSIIRILIVMKTNLIE